MTGNITAIPTEYSISNRPLSEHDIEVLNRTIDLLRQFDEFDRFHDMADVVSRLQDKVASAQRRRPIVDFERNPNLRGLEYLTPIYDIIAAKQTIHVVYRSFNARKPTDFILFPYLLKEYRNRWFLFGSRAGDMRIFNLALDRIVSFKACPDIPYKENPDFGEDFFDDVVGVTKHPRLKKERVRIVADNSQASYVLTKPLHSSQKLVEKNSTDGSMTFEFDVVVNPEFITQILGFGAGVRVVSPQSLVREMRAIYRRGAKLYD